MRISTKGKYGLKAMLDLAINSLGDQVTLKSIAQRQNISEGYLEQVFSALRKSGLVKGLKGSQGGYVLAKSASDITVGDILRVLEGDLSVVDENDLSGADDPTGYCIKCNVWDRLNESVNNIVDSITLDDLVQEYNKMGCESSYIYYI